MILSDNKNEDNKLKKKFIYSREDHISDLYQIKQKKCIKSKSDEISEDSK